MTSTEFEPFLIHCACIYYFSLTDRESQLLVQLEEFRKQAGECFIH